MTCAHYAHVWCFVLAAQVAGAAASVLQEQRHSRAPVVFDGIVFGPTGAPVADAVVVTSAGGKATTDAHGNYRIEVDVPLDAQSLQVTAVGRAGGAMMASAQVVMTGSGTTVTAPLILAQAACGEPSWVPTFEGQPGVDGPSANVTASASFDDGSGPALFVGGTS